MTGVSAELGGQTGTPGAICFVTADFGSLGQNGEIGTHAWMASRLLARWGWCVHVLFCGESDDSGTLRSIFTGLAAQGIDVTVLADMSEPDGTAVQQFGGDHAGTILSQRILHALESLHAEHGFDLIEFPDRWGLGFRPVQAKRVGMALQDVALAVNLHGASRWIREANRAWPQSPRDIKLDYCERYAFERADVQVAPSRYMVDYARGAGWCVRGDIVVAHPFPELEPADPVASAAIDEIAFLGPFERRKGLDLFLDALEALPRELPASFIGKDAEADARPATMLIAERLGDRAHRIETGLDRAGALAEFRGGNRLAVIPSTTESFGLTVAECLAKRIPFLATRVGGVPEVLTHPEAQRRWLVEPVLGELVTAIERRIRAPAMEEAALRQEAAAHCEPARWNARVERCYRAALAQPPSRPSPAATAPSRSPTVTVAIPYYNDAAFLRDALASIAAQTRPPDEVIVVDDGSTCRDARKVFDQERTRYREWTFIHQVNSGPGAARNACLTRARGEFFLPFDADNVARPELLQALLHAIAQDNRLAAVACHYMAFTDPSDIERGTYAFRYAPTGGPLISACVENVYGDSCALFRTDALRAAGGFETERWSPYEDWETFLKLAVRGQLTDVVPAVLFYYRTGSGGRLDQLSADSGMHFRHRQRLLKVFLSQARLTRRESMDLWECVVGFGHLAHEGMQQVAAIHQQELTNLDTWRQGQIEILRGQIAELTASADRVALQLQDAGISIDGGDGSEADGTLRLPARYRAVNRIAAMLLRVAGRSIRGA